MATIDDQIAEQEKKVADMNVAIAKTSEKGATLADYDLGAVTEAVTRDRVKYEQAQRLKAEDALIEQQVDATIASEMGAKLETKNGAIPEQKKIDPTKTQPTKHTFSDFDVNGKSYDIIEDNETARGMIQFDDDGGVKDDSPVKVVGQNANGGFVLAANKRTPNVSKMKIPYSDQGINFSSLTTDTQESGSKMQNIHKKVLDNPADVFDSNAASEIYNIYQRADKD